MIVLEKAEKTALLFGANGLIGEYCLDFLLASRAYTKVKVFTQQPLVRKHPKLELHLIKSDKVQNYADLIKGDDLFCSLDTTQKNARHETTFSKVDYTYAFEIAKIASKNKVNQFILVSSISADPDSSYSHHQVKGRIEIAIQQLDFWTVHIFKTSVLLEHRSENSWGKSITIQIAKVVDFITGGRAYKYRPIEAEQVAKSMVQQAQSVEQGVFIHQSNAIRKM